ncbi:hypothetical protein GOBAR_AA02516 [Gossypium barbadense]|uniref:HpcH/HpaI aldolase/citrate lyase domain-containing protein n=1 Tax=Gossypium barbadense TaxID=3634 RepID=A0A2P5YR69_GOSBA|nr:hypothetical protein GOBAR_AA02516 [Gossypium barbadense]
MASLANTTAGAVAGARKISNGKPIPFVSSKSLSFPSFRPSISSLKPLIPTKFSSLSPLQCSPNPSPSTSPPSLKSRLRNGETLYGIFLLSFSPTLAEIVAFSGYDFVVIDMEHGPGGIHESLQMLRAVATTNTPAIIRLPESSAVWAKKALDLGPQGIMFPMINSPKDARKAVSYCRFPPNGIRGSAHTVMVLKKVEEIAAVEGVDCIQMGPLDLSASLGYLWDPGHKKVREMLRTAEKEVLKSDRKDGGAFLAGFAMPHDPPEALGKRGYQMVSGAIDVGLFRNAAVEDVRKFKISLNADSNDSDDDKDSDEKYWSE